MDPKARVLKTLNHEEPDLVPLMGEGIDSAPILKKYGASSISWIIGIMKWSRWIIGWRKIFGWLAKRPSAMALLGKGIVKLMRKVGYDTLSVPAALLLTKSAFPSSKEYVDRECHKGTLYPFEYRIYYRIRDYLY